tara:strand:- start:38843 stop:39532 length:690 start_codon:yes stop_codon:yes gene_type:complete
MNVITPINEARRQTTADKVFERLQSDIIALRLPPGTKLSEVEMAKVYDVSRQPVREAFLRLGDLNLLEIRPQRATLVKRISLLDIENTRFIRAAVEVEVVRRACRMASPEGLAKIEANLKLQEAAVGAGDVALLHDLDYQFHRLVCSAANCLAAFRTIAENKAHTDRICTLELSDATAMAEILRDHTRIHTALVEGDEVRAAEFTRLHLSRLDATLAKARENHRDYFED